MAIALVMDFDVPEGVDVLSLYDRANLEMNTKGDLPEGLLFHWAARTQQGLRVVDVWKSQALFDRFFQERLGQTMQKLELPQPKIETFDVYNIIAADTLTGVA